MANDRFSLSGALFTNSLSLFLSLSLVGFSPLAFSLSCI